MKTTPSKKFNLNNIKKLIKKNKGDGKFLVIGQSDLSKLLELTQNGFNVSDKVLKSGFIIE